MNTVNVSVPSDDCKNSVTPRCATVSPISKMTRAFAQSCALLADVSDANCAMWPHFPTRTDLPHYLTSAPKPARRTERLAEQAPVDGEILVEKDVEHDAKTGIGIRVEPRANGFDRDLRGLGLRKAEHAGADAAKRDACEALRRRGVPGTPHSTARARADTARWAPPCAIGPTIWMMRRQDRLYAPVTFACAVGSGWPCAAMMRAHSRRSCTPAKVWMALSMHEWSGCQHPVMAEFAAFTIASAAIVVMSPRHSPTRASAEQDATSSTRVIPASAISPCSSSSCTARNSDAAGAGSRVLTRARNALQSSSNEDPGPSSPREASSRPSPRIRAPTTPRPCAPTHRDAYRPSSLLTSCSGNSE